MFNIEISSNVYCILVRFLVYLLDLNIRFFNFKDVFYKDKGIVFCLVKA